MMLSLINCSTYQNFMRCYKMVRLLSLVKNPGMEPVGMILSLTVYSPLFLGVFCLHENIIWFVYGSV